ncbi:MAG: hypothetical protein R3181_07180 [Rubricoccaceae bacterium]|nr:hypothetical protein [Rubricoccaceae bacterium]
MSLRSRRRLGALLPVAALVAAAGGTAGLALLLVAWGVAPWLAVTVAAVALMAGAVAFSLVAPRWVPASWSGGHPRRRRRGRQAHPAARRARGGGRPPRPRHERPAPPQTAQRTALAWSVALVVALMLPEWAAEPFSLFGSAVLHLSAFAVLTWLWLRAAPDAPLRVVGGAVALAAATELAQMFVPALGRGASLPDLAANLGGIGLGVLPWLIAAVQRWSPPRGPDRRGRRGRRRPPARRGPSEASP